MVALNDSSLVVVDTFTVLVKELKRKNIYYIRKHIDISENSTVCYAVNLKLSWAEGQ